MDNRFRPTYLEIDLSCIEKNILAYKNLAHPTQIMAVVKADAYGLGATPVLNSALKAGATWAAVALVEEGIAIRKNFPDPPILLMGTWSFDSLDVINEYELTPLLYSFESLQAAVKWSEKNQKKIKAHLKLDTGMHRIGFNPEDISKLKESLLKANFIDVTGIMSHFASVNIDENNFTKLQLDLFQQSLNKLDLKNVKYAHIAKTAAIPDFMGEHTNIARLGIGMYGLAEGSDKIECDLQYPVSWKSEITFINNVKKGETIGYNQTFKVEKEKLIATIPVGYADGYPRNLSNRFYVLINGKKAPIVGLVCMDMIMVDVSEITEVELGDEVILIGKQRQAEIRISEFADSAGTIPYEIFCNISKRVPRTYTNG